MSTALVKHTPEDLLAMPDGKYYELVDGELVERKMGWESSWIGGELHRKLGNYCEEKNHVGYVVPGDASYQCFPDDPNNVRKPDVSFIRRERLPSQEELCGHCRIYPDLATEVISPNELYSEVEEKVDEYLKAVVSLVWVIDTNNRSVRVHRQNGTVTDLGENDYLDGEGVIPGFRCRVGDLFQLPLRARPAQET